MPSFRRYLILPIAAIAIKRWTRGQGSEPASGRLSATSSGRTI